jgi:hypothetical protein
MLGRHNSPFCFYSISIVVFFEMHFLIPLHPFLMDGEVFIINAFYHLWRYYFLARTEQAAMV